MRIKISEYVQLCRAGYSEQEIAEYCNSLAETPVSSTPIQTESAEKVTEPPAPVAENPAPAPAEQQENETQTMLRELLGLVKAGNINSLSHSNNPAPDACEIMASILSPNK